MAGATTQRALLIAQLGVTAALVTALIGSIAWPQLAEALRKVRYGLLGLALLCFVASAAAEVLRLRVMLSRYLLRWGDLTRLHVIGTFFSSFLPGQLGADLYKVHRIRALDESVDRPLALILLVRLIGLAVILAAALASVLLWTPAVELLQDAAKTASVDARVLIPLTLAVVALTVTLAVPRIGTRIRERVSTFLQTARRALLAVTVTQIRGLVGLSLVILVTRAMTLYFLTASVGFAIAPVDATPVIAFATLVLLLPISFAGLGLREGVVTVLLTWIGSPYEEALLVAILGRLFILTLAGVGCLLMTQELLNSRSSDRM